MKRLRSLRWRLLLATVAAGLLALALAGVLLAGLFRDQVMRQFGLALTAQLDQVTAALDIDARGEAHIDATTLSDPRWQRPLSGLYWQVDRRRPDGSWQRGLLRSRSLWDAELQAPQDLLADGSVHLHEAAGPAGARLLLAERSLHVGASGGDTANSDGGNGGAGPQGAPTWRLLVGADLHETDEAVQRFNGSLLASLALLLLLLAAAAIAQVRVGLAPLRGLQAALTALRQGRTSHLEGRFPTEVQPLIDDFNAVLDRHAEGIARARTQAGNLAHALKTPLAVMAQAAEAAQRPTQAAPATPTPGASAQELAGVVRQQVDVARRQVDRHLSRARAAAAREVPGARCAVEPLLAGLLRVMARVHAERGLQLHSEPIDAGCAFAGDAQDLQEMVGNLIDNACKWARQAVTLRARIAGGAEGARLQLQVDDDGPGIDPALRERALTRGERLDEAVPGSGLGLAIVQELAQLYGGQLTLGPSPAGGLRAELDLPAAPPAAP